MAVRTYESREEAAPVRRAPLGSAALVAGVVLVGLLANGRPIPRTSVPRLSWVASAATAPLTIPFHVLVEPDDVGRALAGKLAASLFCAVAAAFVFLGVARRRPLDDAWASALLFAFGTTVWASAQSLSGGPVATALVAVALYVMLLGEDDRRWAPRAALPLSLAFAADPEALLLVTTIGLVAILRRPRNIVSAALWAAPGVVLGILGAGDPGFETFRFGPEWGSRLLALFVGPEDGLLWFAPVAIVGCAGMVRALRLDEAPLAVGCAAAFVLHGAFVAGGPEPRGGFGPTEWTDAMPLVMLFASHGLDLLKTFGKLLAVISVGIQALGAFTDHSRFERIEDSTAGSPREAFVGPGAGPIALALRERVLILAVPRMENGKARVHEHRIRLFAPSGSRVSAGQDDVRVEGSDPVFGNVHLQAGARVLEGRIRLASAGDAIFLRVRPENRTRELELRVSGRGRGTLTIAESSFWSREPKRRERAVSGDFRVRLPYHYPDSGGADLTVSSKEGTVEIVSLSLVPPREPDDVIRVGPSPAP